MSKAQVGLVGLAVMGENLALNIEEKGFPIAVFNRTVSKVDEFIARSPGKQLFGCRTIPGFVAAIERPRPILLMVKAGEAVDAMITAIRPHLQPGDILVDGGNSHFLDTERRAQGRAAPRFAFGGLGRSPGRGGAPPRTSPLP